MTPSDIFVLGAAFAFLFGALIGSFLNVVIHRVPHELSIVTPGSHCPECEAPVRWFDNIPIVSWFVLGGRCRSCGESFSIRYALIEALTGLLAVAAWWQVAGGLRRVTELPEPDVLGVLAAVFALKFAFLCFLVVIAFTDLDTFLIPHVISIPGIVLGLASPWIVQALVGEHALRVIWPPVTPMLSLVGALLGFAIIVGLFYAYFAVRGVEGIGGGDATLMALIGAWLGWPALIFVLFAASVQGVLAAGVSMLIGGGLHRDATEIFADDGPVAPRAEASETVDDEADSDDDSAEIEDTHEGRLAVPFGPFLCLAALEFALLGPQMPVELNMLYLY